jgi:O-succinylbenzoic acid--CoA ligase
MTRPLEIVSGEDPLAMMERLRQALGQGGAAILPREARSEPAPHTGSIPRHAAYVDARLQTGAEGQPPFEPDPRTPSPAADQNPPDRPPDRQPDLAHRDLAHPDLARPDRQPDLARPNLAQPAAAHPVPDRVPRNVALVIETSGSSGAPKRVALSADALLASAAAVENELGGQGQWLLSLPVHYIAGMQVLTRSIVAGSIPIVQPAGHFSARVFADLVEQLEAPLRFSSLVPAQLARVIDAAEADGGIRSLVQRLDAILVGGQALPQALFERALELGFTVRRTYGSSETAGGCVYDGRPLGQVQARVTAGELELSGPVLAEGYLGDEELTARKFYTDAGRRWYRTADSGDVTPAGLVRVSGRIDNVIISGGIKVSLDRVERVVQSLEGFRGAVVVPQPSEEWGQVSVVVTDGEVSEGSLERIREAVIAGPGRAAAPVKIVRVERMPTLGSGKPDRLALARRLASGS